MRAVDERRAANELSSRHAVAVPQRCAAPASATNLAGLHDDDEDGHDFFERSDFRVRYNGAAAEPRRVLVLPHGFGHAYSPWSHMAASLARI